MYGSTTKGDVVKRSDCILVYGSTTKGGVVKRSDCTYYTIILERYQGWCCTNDLTTMSYYTLKSIIHNIILGYQ